MSVADGAKETNIVMTGIKMCKDYNIETAKGCRYTAR